MLLDLIFWVFITGLFGGLMRTIYEVIKIKKRVEWLEEYVIGFSHENNMSGFN